MTTKPSIPIRIGQIVRGLLLGVLLTGALIGMAGTLSDARLFRYQDF